MFSKIQLRASQGAGSFGPRLVGFVGCCEGALNTLKAWLRCHSKLLPLPTGQPLLFFFSIHVALFPFPSQFCFPHSSFPALCVIWRFPRAVVDFLLFGNTQQQGRELLNSPRGNLSIKKLASKPSWM